MTTIAFFVRTRSDRAARRALQTNAAIASAWSSLDPNA